MDCNEPKKILNSLPKEYTVEMALNNQDVLLTPEGKSYNVDRLNQFMKNLNNYLKIGILFNVIFLVSNSFNLLPEFAKGFCVGLSIVFILLGLYAQGHDISKIRSYKKNIFKRIISK